MSLGAELVRLESRLERDLYDREAWAELGKQFQRTGRMPDIVCKKNAGYIRGAWSWRPHDRSLEPLMLHALGFLGPDIQKKYYSTRGTLLCTDEAGNEVPSHAAGAKFNGDYGSFWTPDKIGGETNKYDAQAGMPLRVYHPKTGLFFHWVPDSAMYKFERNTSPTPAMYVSERLVYKGAYDLFIADGNEPYVRYNSHVDPMGFVTDINWHDATEFCEWAGGRLIKANEWEIISSSYRGGVLFPIPDKSKPYPFGIEAPYFVDEDYVYVDWCQDYPCNMQVPELYALVRGGVFRGYSSKGHVASRKGFRVVIDV